MTRKLLSSTIFVCFLLNSLSASAFTKTQMLQHFAALTIPALREKTLAALFNKALIKKPATVSIKPKVEQPLALIPQAKVAAKPVTPSQKPAITLTNTFTYDAKADFNAFINKMRIDEGFIIANRTKYPIEIKIQYEIRNSIGLCKAEKVTVRPYGFYVFEKRNDVVLNSFALPDKNSPYFLNPKFTEDGHLQVCIETTQDRHFLHQYHPFTFASKKFTQQQLDDPALSQEERNFRIDFNGSCDYMADIAKKEGTSLEAIDEQRQMLYTKNNIAALMKNNPGLIDSKVRRIPLKTHKIWVTSDTDPRDPSIQYIQWFENSIEHNLISSGWTHYFWIESKEKLPKLTKMLENHPNIRLMELNKLDTSTFATGDLYKKAIKEKKFGKATDIIRLELLRGIGGVYLDTDYELYQSLIPYCNAYDMVVGLEPMSVYLCNAFIGACPNHPVINKALEIIGRNLSDQAPEYVKNITNNGFKTIVETGPAAFTLAFALAGGKGEYRDIVLPPQIIYPAITAEYPKKQVVTPDGPIPKPAFGAHYWNTAWMNPAFGSQG